MDVNAITDVILFTNTKDMDSLKRKKPLPFDELVQLSSGVDPCVWTLSTTFSAFTVSIISTMRRLHIPLDFPKLLCSA